MPGVVNRFQSLGKRGIAIIVLLGITLGLGVLWFNAEKKAIVLAEENRYTPSDRHQIYGDPSVLEEFDRLGYANVFVNDGERMLAYFAQPGKAVSMPPELAINPDLLRTALTNEIVFVEGEPRESVELKQIVCGIKLELRDFLEESSPAEYLRCLYERQAEEQRIYLRVVNELEGNADAALREERNKKLRSLGLKTVPKPAKKNREGT